MALKIGNWGYNHYQRPEINGCLLFFFKAPKSGDTSPFAKKTQDKQANLCQRTKYLRVDVFKKNTVFMVL